MDAIFLIALLFAVGILVYVLFGGGDTDTEVFRRVLPPERREQERRRLIRKDARND